MVKPAAQPPGPAAPRLCAGLLGSWACDLDATLAANPVPPGAAPDHSARRERFTKLYGAVQVRFMRDEAAPASEHAGRLLWTDKSDALPLRWRVLAAESVGEVAIEGELGWRDDNPDASGSSSASEAVVAVSLRGSQLRVQRHGERMVLVLRRHAPPAAP